MRKTKPRKRSTPNEAKIKIRELIASSFEEVQSFVFENRNSASAEIDQLLLQQDFVWRAQANGIGTSEVNLAIKLDETWKGSPEDFKVLQEIHNLGGLQLENFELNRGELKSIEKLSGFEDTRPSKYIFEERSNHQS